MCVCVCACVWDFTPFLDTQIIIDEQGTLHHKFYRKKQYFHAENLSVNNYKDLSVIVMIGKVCRAIMLPPVKKTTSHQFPVEIVPPLAKQFIDEVSLIIIFCIRR